MKQLKPDFYPPEWDIAAHRRMIDVLFNEMRLQTWAKWFWLCMFMIMGVIETIGFIR